MTQSGHHSLYVQADSLNEIKDINGFIYVDKDSVHQTPSVLISNVSLIKYHKSKDKTAPKPEVTEEKAEDIKLEKDTPLEPKKANRTKSRPKKPAPKD